MTTYEIKRWDVIMYGNDTKKTPAIYIIPDIYFIEFAKVNEFSLFCRIVDTYSPYDDVIIPVVVNKSSNAPNCRPNFFDETNSYIITLDTNWHGYPLYLGNVKFYGYKNPIPQSKNRHYITS